MIALAKATDPGGIELGSGCGTKCRKPSSPNPKKTSPSRTRAAVGAWRVIALVVLEGSWLEASRRVVACMVVSPMGGCRVFGFRHDVERRGTRSTDGRVFFREE